MSLDPQPVATAPPAPPRGTSGHPILAASFCLVALATGLTLVVIPWVDTWNFNYLQGISPTVEYLWDEPSLRAALTVLGFFNILIGIRQLALLFRATRR